MKCDDCTLRLWCLGLPELQQDGRCMLIEEVAGCVLNMWCIGDLKSYERDSDGSGYQMSQSTRQAIVEKFYDYVRQKENVLFSVIEKIVEEDIKKGVIT